MITKQSKFKKSQKNSNTNISYNNNNPNQSQNFINNNINKTLNTKTNQKEEKNKIDIQNIILQKDKRTTLMIKNIPNKYRF